MKINRFEENPLITPRDVSPIHEGFEVIGAFNAGVAKFKDESILLLRVAERPISDNPTIIKAPLIDKKGELQIIALDKNDSDYNFEDPRIIRRSNDLSHFEYLTSLSYFRLARSKEGRHFTVEDKAFIYPFNNYQTMGCEDPRITQIEDNYYITYTSVSEMGICESLALTTDFETFEDLGNILLPENKDVVLFPERINGNYYMLNRPSPTSIGNLDIWISQSPDLKSWGNHKHLLKMSVGDWDGGRIGAGLPPIRTSKGWLEIYHGATKDNIYCMGALLLDLDDPSKVLAKTKSPIMIPEAPYEKEGFFGDVVFGCGGIVNGDILTMYYGVSDTSMAGCELSISEILEQFS
ncbi:MAG: glycoside hydrolase family 130 protein [Streptococcaceae bacterium]|jgi:predicted GH43/DUF377 family glycosyl hydrolase|nr:glycoside hydrolase family 130 protein [Streptococcaceae bacterium]